MSRINFSELFQLLVHLKVVRTYVESVLRYGLPAAYFVAVVKVSSRFSSVPVSHGFTLMLKALLQPEHKQHSKLLSTLSDFLVPASSKKDSKDKKKKKSSNNDEEAMGEFASVMEGEYHEFVVFEIEKVED